MFLISPNSYSPFTPVGQWGRNQRKLCATLEPSTHLRTFRAFDALSTSRPNRQNCPAFPLNGAPRTTARQVAISRFMQLLLRDGAFFSAAQSYQHNNPSWKNDHNGGTKQPPATGPKGVINRWIWSSYHPSSQVWVGCLWLFSQNMVSA
jgi:hypothetical protein